jgi:hypothetical protein
MFFFLRDIFMLIIGWIIYKLINLHKKIENVNDYCKFMFHVLWLYKNRFNVIKNYWLISFIDGYKMDLISDHNFTKS